MRPAAALALLAASASDVTRSAAHQKASRDAALATEQLEQQLSALKSSCASLEAEVSAQRLLAESSSEAADEAAARAHASLTQNIVLRKKMKDELPHLVDALAKAQAERDAAVKQREADAVSHTVERNMMSSKLAGTSHVTAHVCTRCSPLLQRVHRRPTPPSRALGCCSSSASEPPAASAAAPLASPFLLQPPRF